VIEEDLMDDEKGMMIGPMARRAFLGTAAAGTAAAVLAACGGSSSAKIAVPTATPPVTIAQTPAQATIGTDATGFAFFEDEILNFNSLFAAGASGIASAFGEVVTAVQQAKSVPGGPTYQSWFDAMNAMGNQLVDMAEQSMGQGHVVTARDRFLRAASYFDQALFFVLGTSTPGAEKDAYLAMNSAWTTAAGLFQPAFEPVSIPYEGGTLPAWFLRAPGASGRRPTLIVNNGSDAQNVDTYVYGGAAALERGWNALLFEGPGQGSQLFVDNVVFRPDWENVVTPIVDYLVKRSDVDAKRIALTGWSMGGELAARAAAFESRLAAVVLDPGYIDIYAIFPAELRKVAEGGDQATVNKAWNEVVVPGATPMQQFTLKKRLEIFTQAAHQESLSGKVPTDWYTISRTMQQYTVSEVAHQITMPTLVVTYEDDSALTAGTTTPSVATLLPKGSTTEVTLGTNTGSEYHCAPMNPEWRNEVVFDWLDETLG
jgi:pimeloyl-ACP methyl ester carboxylesterase